jgi:hypothetical protein
LEQLLSFREAWESGLVLGDYWLPQRKTISDLYLPSLKEMAKLEGMQPVWYLGTLTLAAGATGRLRIAVDPGFALTMIIGTSSAANPADGLGAAQVQIFDNARRARFSSRPIVSPVVFGTASDPFIFPTPYVWTGTDPVLITLQNRQTVSNTINMVLHGWRRGRKQMGA